MKSLPDFIRNKLEESLPLRKILINTSWQFAEKAIRLVLGLFVGVWVARYLGPEQFGLLNYAGAFVVLLSSMSTMGLDNIVVRNLVSDPFCRDTALGTSFVLKLVGSVVTVPFTLFAIMLIRPVDVLTHCLVGILAAATIFQAFDTIDFWFRSQVQSKYTVYARSAAFITVAGIKLIIILLKAPLIVFAWASFAESILTGAGLVLAYRKAGLRICSWTYKLSYAKNLLSDSWPLILSGVVVAFYLRIDQVMLGQMVGNHEVGIYSAAVRIAEAWYFVPAALSISFFPSVIDAKTQSDELFFQRLQRYYNLMAFIGYLIALPMTFLSGLLIKVLFGNAYLKAGPMLALLVWAGLFVNLGVARSSFLMTMNWAKVHLLTVALGCVVNVALNLVLIPHYGGMGAVIASLFAYWVAAHGSCFLYKPMFNTGKMLAKALIYPRIW